MLDLHKDGLRKKMDILIAFVSNHDPQSSRGPAQTVTAAKAIEPQHICLLYTDKTELSCQKTVDWLSRDLAFKNTLVHTYRLDIPDARDYGRLSDVLPNVLEGIRREYRGSFYLVSGHPHVRLVMGLCLNAYVMDGNLLDVLDPDPENPFPNGKKGYQERVLAMDLGIFEKFRERARRRWQNIRLNLDLSARRAFLDNKPFDLRATRSSDGGPPRHRTFELLVLIAAKKRYGQPDDLITKPYIAKNIYSGIGYCGVNIRRAIDSLNRQARRLSRKSGVPLDPMICGLEQEEHSTGSYRMTDKLAPVEEAINFTGDLHVFLTEIGCNVRQDGFVGLP
jgi:hypothetical protein